MSYTEGLEMVSPESLLRRIRELELTVSNKDKEISELTIKIEKCLTSRRKLKEKYQRIKPSQTRKKTLEAIELIKKKKAGLCAMTLRQIADKCFISYSRCRSISCEINKGLK